MSDAVEGLARAIETAIQFDGAFGLYKTDGSFTTTPASIDAISRIAKLAAEAVVDQLAARDAEVTRMALEVAAGVASNLTQKPSMVDEAYQTYQLCRHNHGNEIAAAILALAPLATGMKLVPVEPTEAMVNAGYSKITLATENGPHDMANVYRAMLAAVTVKP